MASTLGNYAQDLLKGTSVIPYTSVGITQITDTADTNARRKVLGAYTKWCGLTGLRDAQVAVDPGLSTIKIGFAASELIHGAERPDRVLVGVNCSGPDKDKEHVGAENNHRKDFYVALLESGDIVCGSVNGHEFSYIKPDIRELYRLTTTNSRDSQFRSYEELPKGLLLFANEETRQRGIELNVFERVENIDDIITSPPDVPHVVEVDNFQNPKICTTPEYLDFLRGQEGRNVQIAFGRQSLELGFDPKEDFGAEFPAQVTASFFEAPVGTNILTTRSSSTLTRGQAVPMLATLRANPALTDPAYPVPQVGAPVRIAPLGP
ncbi:MAG TPA: hypothetical protein DIS76_01790 [Rhodospirillaceae bacterium]|nr:hypothetical protein [Rhodospirillaceae bacterium]